MFIDQPVRRGTGLPVSSLYIHIPFCLCKCAYCSFSSFGGLDHLYERYVSALLVEIGLESQQQPAAALETLFIGGGTPTVLAAADLARIILVCAETYTISPDAEISIEANPGTVSLAELELLHKAGVNRLSLGVQSLRDDELAALGRRHTAAHSLDAFYQARQAGFTNISIDLMYGLPGQTEAGWREGLEQALSLEPEHLSMYQLSVEPTTLFFERQHRGELDLPTEDSVVAMDDTTFELCEKHGYQRYEISNFSRPGFRCRHNLVYWQNKSYYGCGAGAVSYVDGTRAKRIPGPRDYCKRITLGRSVIEESERLVLQDTFKETVVMGLRLIDGVCERNLTERFGFSLSEVYGDILDGLMAENLLEMRGTKLRLTERGLRFANMVMAELV